MAGAAASGVLSDTASTARRNQALAALQAADPAVQVDFSLAVSPQGLSTAIGSEYALLQDAKAKGVKIAVVNLMTMDFGNGQNALARAGSGQVPRPVAAAAAPRPRSGPAATLPTSSGRCRKTQSHPVRQPDRLRVSGSLG